MRWISHLAIACSICAVFNPVAVPAAALGSTAPDWFEFIKRAIQRDRRVKHRGSTHYLVGWVAAALAAHFVWDFQGFLFWFAIGGAVHWFCDALTVSGAPLGWWSDRHIMLFGGKVKTGGSAEYIIAGLVMVVCALLIWTKHASPSGFIPFFYEWSQFYQRGLIDGIEWRNNRFNII
jgi:inner membrane protein